MSRIPDKVCIQLMLRIPDMPRGADPTPSPCDTPASGQTPHRRFGPQVRKWFFTHTISRDVGARTRRAPTVHCESDLRARPPRSRRFTSRRAPRRIARAKKFAGRTQWLRRSMRRAISERARRACRKAAALLLQCSSSDGILRAGTLTLFSVAPAFFSGHALDAEAAKPLGGAIGSETKTERPQRPRRSQA